MKTLLLSAAVTAALLTTAAKAETINCTEIASIPAIITAQGIYCLKHDLSSPLTSGNMIDIQANNVTIDLNGFKLGGLGAGPGTTAVGIHALNRKNITLRNGSIRGFFRGIFLRGTSSSGGLLEDLLLDGNRIRGIDIAGSGHTVRNNRVVNTRSTDFEAYAILVESASNTVVADNILSGTSAASTAGGIFVAASSALIELRNNTILDARDAINKRGILIGISTDVTVIGNRILNAAGTGTSGIASPHPA